MGLESLLVFTLLGGLAAGWYVSETALFRKREGERTWLVPLVVAVLFLVGLIAAATHVHSIPRAFDALFGGTVNFGSGMIREVAVSGLFFVLVVVDLVITLVKKDSPFALRVVGAVVAVICIVMMGVAYVDVYGVAVWCNAPATVLTFLAGDLAMGLALAVAFGAKGYGDKVVRCVSLAVNVVLAIALGLEIAAFSAEGADPLPQIAALVVAPVASVVLVALSPKVKNEKALAVAVCAVSIIGIAVSRYAFYAVCTVA